MVKLNLIKVKNMLYLAKLIVYIKTIEKTSNVEM